MPCCMSVSRVSTRQTVDPFGISTLGDDENSVNTIELENPDSFDVSEVDVGS